MAKWKMNSIGKNEVEVFSPQVRFVLKADNKSVSVKAYKDDALIEENTVKRSGHEYTITASESDGSKARLVTTSDENRMVTAAVINGDKFKVESKPIEHGPLMIYELKKRSGPKLKHIRSLTDQIRMDIEFREELIERTQLVRLVKQPNGTIGKCVTACFLCALQSALNCLVCGICIGPVIKGELIARN